MRHIAILLHEKGELHATGYFMRSIADVWRADGIKVSLLNGPGPMIDADVAIMHVDLTVVPQPYIDFIQQFPRVMNASVRDISKRHVSTNLVSRGDGYKGAVIVKTDRNYGGRREAELSAGSSRLGKYMRGIRRRLPWTMSNELDVYKYPIYDTVDEVPRAVWINPDLIVERFLPERRDGFFCLRTWTFLGNQEQNLLLYATTPIIKTRLAVKKEDVPVPDELRQIRQQLGFDFGRFDYGIVDGKVILYDANRTPVMGDLTPEYVPVVRRLANGIKPFLMNPDPIRLHAPSEDVRHIAA